jgi:hypothetical protein
MVSWDSPIGVRRQFIEITLDMYRMYIIFKSNFV